MGMDRIAYAEGGLLNYASSSEDRGQSDGLQG